MNGKTERPAIALVLEHLNKKYNCNLESDYYNRIDQWVHWWEGYYEPFHKRKEWNGEKVTNRELFTMRMAKKICEDWAAILLNEKTTVTVEDNASSLYLQGEDGTGGVFGDNDFWRQANALIERAFATGTGAFVLRLSGIGVADDGTIQRGQGSVKIAYLDAPCIVPISIEGGKVTEAAFASSVVDKGERYIYLESHVIEGGQYVIHNEYFKMKNGALSPDQLPDGVPDTLYTGGDVPWFVLLAPNVVNTIRHNNGLGMSIFGNSIDNLKGVDLAFNNFCQDFKLGGKKVFYNKSLARTDEQGRTITPDDVAQQLFTVLGDGDVADLDTKDLVHEFNPELRVEENRTGLQAQLDYLSFKCGLGPRRYRFEAGTVQTATEYTGSQQELVQNANKHYIVVERALQSLSRAILYLGKEFCGQPVNPDAKVSVQFEDSYIIDKESERQRDLQEVRDGLMMDWEYRVKWRGETEDDAKKILSGKKTDDDWMGFKGE